MTRPSGITGPNVAANGTASFDRSGSLSVLNFASVKMGALNDLSFALTRTAAGDDYVLRGHSLDGSMIGRTAGKTGSAAANGAAAHDDTPTGPFHINAKLDRLAMRDGVAIAPFNLELSGIGNRPSRLVALRRLSAKPRSAAVSKRLPTGRKMTIEAGDAGQLIKGLFAFHSIKGGKLKLVANLPGRAGEPDVGRHHARLSGHAGYRRFPGGEPAPADAAVLRRIAHRHGGSDGRRGHLAGESERALLLQEQCDQRA